jgi:CheY-like chemotaxis protein
VVLCDPTEELYAQFAHGAGAIEFVQTHGLAEAIAAAQECPAHAMIVNCPSMEQAAFMAEQARIALEDTPIVACTFQSPFQRARKAGAIGYLLKPVVSGKLKEMIQQVATPVQRVLIVEDNRDIQLILQRMFMSYNGITKVTTVASGRHALDELRHDPPSLMLLDIILPDMDGWQVLDLKNQEPALRDIPVIIVSAQDPSDQPPATPLLTAAIGQGFSISKLLQVSLLLSTLLLKPAPAPGQLPG